MAELRKFQNYNKLFISMISVFFSSLIINIFLKKGIKLDYLVFSIEDIKRVITLPVVSAFIVLCIKRIKQAVVIILLMKFFKPETVYNLIIIFLSIIYGIIMSVQAYTGGIAYVGVFIISILPHYIIYFLCVDLIYRFYTGRVFNKNKLRFGLSVLMLTMLGAFSEENFLRFFLR